MSATFGKFKESTNSSEYIKNKRFTEILCNKASCSSDIVSKKSLESCEIYPFNKKNLIVNLYSRLDLQSVKTICKGTNVCGNASQETNIDVNLIPLYQYYIIDPNGALFGNSECAANNYTEYIVPDICEDVDGDGDGDV